jgi:hypothetical protein
MTSTPTGDTQLLRIKPSPVPLSFINQYKPRPHALDVSSNDFSTATARYSSLLAPRTTSEVPLRSHEHQHAMLHPCTTFRALSTFMWKKANSAPTYALRALHAIAVHFWGRAIGACRSALIHRQSSICGYCMFHCPLYEHWKVLQQSRVYGVILHAQTSCPPGILELPKSGHPTTPWYDRVAAALLSIAAGTLEACKAGNRSLFTHALSLGMCSIV